MTNRAVACDLALDDGTPHKEAVSGRPQAANMSVEAEALHARGLAEAAAGNAETALELLSKAAECNPQEAEYFISIGRLLAAETMFNQAALAYLRAQEMAPNDPMILSELADVLGHLNKDEEVLAMLHRIAERLHAPTGPQGHRP